MADIKLCANPGSCSKAQNCRRSRAAPPGWGWPYEGGDDCSGYYPDKVLPMLVAFKDED